MSKFILTGFPRTGTTVISGSLILHPQALFYGELFNDTPQVRHNEAMRLTLGGGWKFDKPLDRGIAPCAYEGSARQYMDNFFSTEVPAPFKTTGFKILFHQALQGPNSDAWSYLADNPDIKIIRTKRENIIEIICSYVRANMTRRWHIGGGDVPKHKFIVPPKEFLELLKKFENVPAPMQGIEESHQVLELDYGRICEDFNGCMADIYSFLDIDAGEKIPPRLAKIAQMKPNEELANYDELKQHFQNTQYSKYFTY